MKSNPINHFCIVTGNTSHCLATSSSRAPAGMRFTQASPHLSYEIGLCVAADIEHLLFSHIVQRLVLFSIRCY